MNRGIVAEEWKLFSKSLQSNDGSEPSEQELNFLRDFYYAGAAFVLSEIFARAYASRRMRGDNAQYFGDLRDEMTAFMVQNQKRLGIEAAIAASQKGSPGG